MVTDQEVIGFVDDAIDNIFKQLQKTFPEIESGILFKNSQSYHRFHITLQNVVKKWLDGEGWSK